MHVPLCRAAKGLLASVLGDQVVNKHGLPIRIKILPGRVVYPNVFVLEQDAARTLLQLVGKRILLPGRKAVRVGRSAVNGICFHKG